MDEFHSILLIDDRNHLFYGLIYLWLKKKHKNWVYLAHSYVVLMVNYWSYDHFSIDLGVLPLGLPVTSRGNIYYWLICSAMSSKKAINNQYIMCLVLHVQSLSNTYGLCWIWSRNMCSYVSAKIKRVLWTDKTSHNLLLPANIHQEQM